MSKTAIDPICADCGKPIRNRVIWTDDESAFHPDCYPHGKEFGVNFKRAGEYVASIRAQAYREGQERMRERCAGVADNHILRGLVTNSVAYEIRQLEPEPEQ